jgi:hypothetical protein
MISVMERLTIDSGRVRVNWTKGKRLFFVFFYFVRFGSGLRLRCAQARGLICPYHQTPSAWRGTSDKCHKPTSDQIDPTTICRKCRTRETQFAGEEVMRLAVHSRTAPDPPSASEAIALASAAT